MAQEARADGPIPWHSAPTDSPLPPKLLFVGQLESFGRLSGVCKKVLVCARKFWTTLGCVQEKPKEPKGFAPLFFFPPFLSLSPVNRLTASPPHCGQCESNVLFS